MDISELEILVIQCLLENIEQSGEEVPLITKKTIPVKDVSGFDSLRTIEVMISIEERLDCELPPEKLFSGKNYEEISVELIVNAIYELIRVQAK